MSLLNRLLGRRHLLAAVLFALASLAQATPYTMRVPLQPFAAANPLDTAVSTASQTLYAAIPNFGNNMSWSNQPYAFDGNGSTYAVTVSNNNRNYLFTTPGFYMVGSGVTFTPTQWIVDAENPSSTQTAYLYLNAGSAVGAGNLTSVAIPPLTRATYTMTVPSWPANNGNNGWFLTSTNVSGNWTGGFLPVYIHELRFK